jgi:twitching motility two-component system response regulator PilH
MKRFTLKNLFNREAEHIPFTERRKHKRPPNGYNLTVLIVDDSRTVVSAFRKVLNQAGFHVVSADDGEQGIIQARLYLPDLILMDVVMPGLNGFQATRQIRNDDVTSHIPIIFVSGEEHPSEQFWGTRAGGNGFLSKPVDRGLFFTRIFEVLEKHSVIKIQ